MGEGRRLERGLDFGFYVKLEGETLVFLRRGVS